LDFRHRPLHAFADQIGGEIVMKIAISGLYVKPGQVGGVEQFLYNILSGLDGVDGTNTYYFYCFEDTGEILNDLNLSNRFKIRTIKRVAGINRFLVEIFQLPGLLKKDGCSGVWFPNYFLPPLLRMPSVVTIHDLQFKHLPGLFSPQKRLWMEYAISRTLAKAGQVVTISHWCAGDIARLYGRRPVVVHNGITGDFAKAESAPRDFLLNKRKTRLALISHQYKHKNIATAIRAMNHLETDWYALEVIGQIDSGTDEVRRAIAALKPAFELREHGYLKRGEMMRLLGECDIFIFPSIFEGFGMPVVEAMLGGIPVVASDLPVLREVSLGRATYVKEYLDPPAWAGAIGQVRRKIIDRQIETCAAELRARFAPRVAAAKYCEIFRNTFVDATGMAESSNTKIRDDNMRQATPPAFFEAGILRILSCSNIKTLFSLLSSSSAIW
jgi:glycosyltransferase involved in cell wall biosynthesis